MLEEYLIKSGYEQIRPWQFLGDSYLVIRVQDSDSYGFKTWSITNNRYGEVVFRGRIRSIEEFNHILLLVKEDYDLTEEEIKELK